MGLLCVVYSIQMVYENYPVENNIGKLMYP